MINLKAYAVAGAFFLFLSIADTGWSAEADSPKAVKSMSQATNDWINWLAASIDTNSFSLEEVAWDASDAKRIRFTAKLLVLVDGYTKERFVTAESPKFIRDLEENEFSKRGIPMEFQSISIKAETLLDKTGYIPVNVQGRFGTVVWGNGKTKIEAMSPTVPIKGDDRYKRIIMLLSEAKESNKEQLRTDLLTTLSRGAILAGQITGNNDLVTGGRIGEAAITGDLTSVVQTNNPLPATPVVPSSAPAVMKSATNLLKSIKSLNPFKKSE